MGDLQRWPGPPGETVDRMAKTLNLHNGTSVSTNGSAPQIVTTGKNADGTFQATS